ncbi:MAG TPA: hypothetical protein VJT49_16200 [Amycolatopsis sp.]|uniref:hypothetical protein n=1 Tax=Amycolatopsis sp. TaxID=37632 RepID=UPI002B45ABCC|nr:hypothetical protein [Amycolatopsis sp.]HKS46621.1 hypothetical protein [Amycolatopsis sp.]
MLMAMWLDANRGLSTLRLSLGRWSTRDDIDRAAQLIIAFAHRQPHHSEDVHAGLTKH